LLKSKEIIFVDKKREHNFYAPSKLTDIQRVDALKILGDTVTNSLHIQAVISSCTQAIYVLRVLLDHVLHERAIQSIYRSVVLAKLLYASFLNRLHQLNAIDRQKIQAFLNRSKRSAFCEGELEDFDNLCATSDQQ